MCGTQSGAVTCGLDREAALTSPGVATKHLTTKLTSRATQTVRQHIINASLCRCSHLPMHKSCTSRPLCRQLQCTCRCQTVSNYCAARFQPSIVNEGVRDFCFRAGSLVRLPMQWSRQSFTQPHTLHTHGSLGRLKMAEIMRKILITAIHSTLGPCVFCLLSCFVSFLVLSSLPSPSFLPLGQPSGWLLRVANPSISMNPCMHAYILTYTALCVHLHSHVHTHTHARAHIHIIYIYIYINT